MKRAGCCRPIPSRSRARSSSSSSSAATVEAARVLVEAAARTSTPLLVGHHRRHNPVLQAARDIVQSGRLGKLTAVAALWLLQKPDAYFDTAWRRQAGGGPLLINFI